MTPLELLEEAKQKGIALKVEGDRLLYQPPSAVTPDLKESMRKHKDQIIELLTKQETETPSSEIVQRLQKAIAQKQEDLKIRRRQLADPEYPNPEFCTNQIICMQGHIAEINRYLNDGGELVLPRCCRQYEYYCFLGMKRFEDGCIWSPDGCEFGLRL